MPSVTVEELENIKQIPQADEEEFAETEEGGLEDELQKASNMLKRTAILLLFLSDRNFCRSITNRERGIMDKHVEAIYKVTDSIEEALEEAEDDE